MTASTFENPTIPWPLVPLKRVLRFRNGEPFAHVESSHGDYPVYGSGGEFARADDFLHDGTSVLFGRKGTVDKPLLVRGRFWCIDTMFYTRLDPSVDARFVHYFATTIPYTLLATDTARPSMTQTDLGEVKMPFPSLQEQRAIADLLDRETAQIDAMIEAQKIVRESLFEVRSALAERLIIYGVSGSAVFRESGLPWAPELPAHWQVGKVLRGYTVTLGKMLDEKRVSFVDDVQTPYIRAANIQDHGLDLSDVKTMPFRPIELRRLDLRAGDLLVVEGGSIGTNVVLANDLPDFSFQKTVNRARPRSEHDSRYLGHWLKMLRDHGVLAMLGNQSTIAHFTAEKLEALPVPFPPVSEQREIADRIEAQTRDLDRSIAAAIDLEALLRERREALITAAVTGRMDPATGIETVDPTTEKEAL